MLKFFQKRKGEKGFTLIELLVVIAIIGVLATIVLVSLNTAREKARDTRRISDMRQVALALEMYYDDQAGTATGYPGTDDSESWSALESALEPDYMTSVPADPGTGDYFYVPGDGNSTYILGATLEDGNNSNLNTDIDGSSTDVNGVNLSAAGVSCDDPAYCIQP